MPSEDFFLCRLCEKLSKKNCLSLRQFPRVALVSTTRAATIPTKRGENDVLPPGGVHSLHKHIIKPQLKIHFMQSLGGMINVVERLISNL